jgi:hypothetical protein
MTKEVKHLLWVIFLFAVFSRPKLVERIKSFLVWYITINFEESPLSVVGQILCRVLSFAISYCAVGALFHWMGWFNSTAMRIAYLVISLLVTMVVSYIIMIFEQHMVLICCLLMGTTVVILATVLVCRLRSKEKAEQ